jgi:hypothetical protein
MHGTMNLKNVYVHFGDVMWYDVSSVLVPLEKYEL